MQSCIRPEIHPGDGSHGKTHDGQRTGLEGMGGIKDGSFTTETKEGNQMCTVDEVVESYTNKLVEETFGDDMPRSLYLRIVEIGTGDNLTQQMDGGLPRSFARQ